MSVRPPSPLLRVLLPLVGLLGATPALAQSYGGGGITVHQAALGWDVGQLGPNVLGCVGGLGYGVQDGRRTGGEGHFCDGPFGNMAMGGAHMGLQGKRGGVWFTGYNTLGAGWIGMEDLRGGRFDGAFVYTRPSLGAGVAVGSWAAVEGSVFAMLPLNVLGVVQNGAEPHLTFPHVGLQATLLFGDFGRRSKVREAPDAPRGMEAPPEPPARPYPPPPPPREGPPSQQAPARQGPLQPGDLPRAQPDEPPPPPPSDDRPLAIPG